jgi:CheY-like chemotaxis protein
MPLENKEDKMVKNKAKILIIDDDPDFIDAVTPILESALYDVVAALSPDEGEEKIFAEKPNLILLDIMMDSLFDGFSLCHAIKTSEEYKEFNDTPIIFVSAVKEKTGSRFQFNAQEQGMVGPDDYIDKPVKADDLIARIEKLLK